MSRKRPQKPGVPPTYFASPERAKPEELQNAVRGIANSPIVNVALEMLSSWLAVINEHRQLLAVNHSLLLALGIEEPDRVLGLRPGEALGCVHAQDHPAGCGTSRFCRTCGAAIAIVAAQQSDQPQERECVMTVKRDGGVTDHDFLVRCCPFEMNGHKLALLSMSDVSEEKHRMALERSFLHDLGNALLGLDTEVHRLQNDDLERVARIRQAVSALTRELRVQRILMQDGMNAWLETEDTCCSELLAQLKELVSAHATAREQELVFEQHGDDKEWSIDAGLLIRVLTNMVLNALEAGQSGDQVRITAEAGKKNVVFRVWNRQLIPEEISWRIFQRYFSTKPGNGRGLGTFTMKLLGEKLLGGKVEFTSTPKDGTTFSIRLPRRQRKST